MTVALYEHRSGKEPQQENNHNPNDCQGKNEPENAGYYLEDDIHRNGSDNNDNERLH